MVVISAMGNTPSHSRRQERAQRIVVKMPRREDAVGGALRGAYGRERNLPDDMQALLDQLDGIPAKQGTGRTH
jgi:hypothetical protein